MVSTTSTRNMASNKYQDFYNSGSIEYTQDASDEHIYDNPGRLYSTSFSGLSKRNQAVPVSNDYDVNVLSNYYQISTLGQGSSGTVIKAIDNRTRRFVAIKEISKANKKPQDIQMIYDEIQILQNLHHNGIIRFEEWLETQDNIFLITEIAMGGELLDRLLNSEKFTEYDAARITRQLLDTIRYMHSQDIVHGDLKLENVLYKDREKDSSIVIVDFGVSKKIPFGEFNNKVQGSMGYMAPEFFKESGFKGYNRQVDIFALGVIVFVLLYGYFPFKETQRVDVYLQEIADFNIENMKKSEFISTNAKGFISWCLMFDPNERPGVEDMSTHKWVEVESDTGNLDHGYDLIPSLRKTIHEWR